MVVLKVSWCGIIGSWGRHPRALAAPAKRGPGVQFRPRGHRRRESEKDAELSQNLGQLQPFLAVFPQEHMGQLASFGPT
jgi:hypothetical protein